MYKFIRIGELMYVYKYCTLYKWKSILPTTQMYVWMLHKNILTFYYVVMCLRIAYYAKNICSYMNLINIDTSNVDCVIIAEWSRLCFGKLLLISSYPISINTACFMEIELNTGFRHVMMYLWYLSLILIEKNRQNTGTAPPLLYFIEILIYNVFTRVTDSMIKLCIRFIPQNQL